MFESDDWNFDEEAFHDDEVLEFCTQVENEVAEQPTKKRKLNECQNTNISINKIFSKPQDLINDSKDKINRIDGDNVSRTNFILGIFQQNSQKKDDTKSEYESNKIHNVSQTSSFNNILQNNVNSQMVNESKLKNDTNQQTFRKNIVLDILKKKNVQNETDNSGKLSTSVSLITPLYISNQKTINGTKGEACHNTTLQKSNSCPQSVHTSSFFQQSEPINIYSKPKNSNQKPTASQEHDRRSEESVKKESINLKESINKNVDGNKQSTYQESRKRLLMQHLKPSTSNEGFVNNIKPTSFTSKTEKQSTKKTTLVRKFPGPAGLLPDVIDNSLLSTLCLPNLEDNKAESVQDKKNTTITEYCSQNTKTLFTEGAWQMMLDDIPSGLLENYEIAEIKEIASENQQECTKIPFLAGIIESIDYSHTNPLIVLKDFTDTIEGIIHADIPIKYPGALDKNVVILLQNVGLLCISGAFVVRKYHILISPLNLLAVYSHKGDILYTPQMEILKKESGMLESNSMNFHTQKQKEKLASKNDRCNATFESLDESLNCDTDIDFQSEDNLDNSRLSIKEMSMKEEKENIHSDKTSPLQISTNTPTKYLKNIELNLSNEMKNDNKKQNTSTKSKLSAFRCNDVLTQVESNSENTSENKFTNKSIYWTENVCNSDNDSDDEMLSQLDVDNMF